MPTRLDLAFVIGFAIVVAAVEGRYLDPRMKARIAAGVPNARRDGYRYTVVKLWGITAVALLLWARARRPWSVLGLVPRWDWHLVPGILVTALMVALTVRQFRAVRRLSAGRRAALRERLAAGEFFLPHTPAEHRWWVWPGPLAAGVCEELLYRGFLTWAVAWYVGLPVAIGVASVAFGLAHAFLGRDGVIRAGLVGLVMSLIVVLTGWLGPAMIVHALLDVGAGDVAFAVYGEHPAAA